MAMAMLFRRRPRHTARLAQTVWDRSFLVPPPPSSQQPLAAVATGLLTRTMASKSPLLDDDDDEDEGSQRLVSNLMMWGKSSFVPKGDKGAASSGDVINVPFNVDISGAFATGKEDAVTRVICGATDTAWITAGGRCFVMGQNKEGQLGLGHKQPVSKPTELVMPSADATGVGSSKSQINEIALGPKFSAMIDTNGDLYTCGFGGSAFAGMGNLGLGSAESFTTPQLVTSLIEDGVFAKQAVVGESHLTVLTTEGEVLTTGAGSYGRLGNFDTLDQLYLEPVELLTTSSNIIGIAGGKSFTLALTKDGVIYGWGRNHKGQLGTGLGMAVDMYAMQSIPEPIETDELVGRKVVQIAAGQGHAAAITEGGEMFVWGMQLYLEPVRVNELLHTQIVQVSCGNDYTLAVDMNGNVYSFGKGKNGCLALGGSVKKANQATKVEAIQRWRATQVSAGWDHAACLVKEHDP